MNPNRTTTSPAIPAVDPETIHAATLVELHAVYCGLASWRRSRPIACCPATESEPCLSCEGLGHAVEFVPTEEDLLDYQRWCREREDRLWRERIAGPTLVEKIRAVANIYLDDLDNDLKGLGEWIWEVAEEAESLEARTWEGYLDRRDAALDCAADMAGTRWATNPIRW